MAIYESTFSGLKLSETGINNLSLSAADLRGYFSADDLRPILSQAGCVGIRFYNVKRINGSAHLIAVAVNADGFDLRLSDGTLSIHLSSHDAKTPVHSGTTAVEISREHASISIGALKVGGQLEEPFSSFFLKETLETLLADPMFTGVCFYATSLEAVPAGLLPNTINPTGKLTHLAVTSDLNNEGIVGIDSTLAFNNAFCDRPCPGHCVNFDASGNIMLSETPVKVDEHDFNGPYIPSWD